MEEKRLDIIEDGSTLKGHIVKKKYYYDNEKGFIIFENEKDEIIYFAQKQVTEISSLLGKINIIKDIVHGEKTKLWINAQKAAALNEFFCEHESESKKILKKCISIVEKKELARKRIIYIGTYLGITILFVCLIILLNIFKIDVAIMKYLYICMFGSFGGFISLNTRLEKIEFRLYEGTWSYILVSVYKIAFSCVSSVIAYFMLESELILSVFKGSTSIAYIIAVLAGFSESLLPNIFSGIEQDIVSGGRE